MEVGRSRPGEGREGKGWWGRGEEYREGTMEWEVEGRGRTDGVGGGGNNGEGGGNNRGEWEVEGPLKWEGEGMIGGRGNYGVVGGGNDGVGGEGTMECEGEGTMEWEEEGVGRNMMVRKEGQDQGEGGINFNNTICTLGLTCQHLQEKSSKAEDVHLRGLLGGVVGFRGSIAGATWTNGCQVLLKVDCAIV